VPEPRSRAGPGYGCGSIEVAARVCGNRAGRVALELTEETALALADAIHRAVASAPTGLASKNQTV